MIVSTASEPILAQVRLAWWRAELGKAPAERTDDQGTLRMLGATWSGEEVALISLIDGWERLLAGPPLGENDIAAFADGRAKCFAALARLAGFPQHHADAGELGRIWALADFRLRTIDRIERQIAEKLGDGAERATSVMPLGLRHLAVLGGLGARALSRAPGPLVAGRRDVMAAMRLGMLGR